MRTYFEPESPIRLAGQKGRSGGLEASGDAARSNKWSSTLRGVKRVPNWQHQNLWNWVLVGHPIRRVRTWNVCVGL